MKKVIALCLKRGNMSKNMKNFILDFFGLLGFLGFVLLIVAIIVSCSGCSSQGLKQLDMWKQSKEQNEKLSTDLKAQGDNNKLAFTKIQETQETNHNETIKLASQVKDGVGVGAKEIKDLRIKQKSTTNSTWLIICLFAMMILAFVFIIKTMSLTGKVKRVIADGGNSLTDKKWKEVV